MAATLEAPVQLLDRLLDDGQRDDRGGEDAAVVVERPVLVHPLVERVNDGVGEEHVVGGAFLDDFTARKGEDAVDREALLEVLTDFLNANNLKVDWEGIESAPNEALVNALAMMSPYGPAEKQAMLEAPDLKTRAEILIAVTEMDLAKKRTSGDTGLQ